MSAGEVVAPGVGVELVNPVVGSRVVFRATAASTDGAYVEVEQTYPPRSDPPPTHLHPQQDERFEVLRGRLRAVVDGEEHLLGPGEVLEVPRGTPHQMHAVADEPTVMIWRTSPALGTDRLFCDLWQAAADNGFEPDLLAAYQVVQRYPDEFCLC